MDTQLRAASRAILRAAGYVGAATCEFLLGQDGTLAFLETNARLAVAHPVREEVAGLDMVRETFRMAEGEPVGYGDPEVGGHALQFGSTPRIRAAASCRLGGACATGVPLRARCAARPGVGPGSVITAAFGTLLAKLIVTGAFRAEALNHAGRHNVVSANIAGGRAGRSARNVTVPARAPVR